MNKNQNLGIAKVIRNDEFYTRLSDIENELQHYTKHFKGKVVLCNCDDPFTSNFFRYFMLNFIDLELKALICTCYADCQDGSTEQQQNTDGDDINYRCKRHGYKAVVTNVQHIKGKSNIEKKDIAELLQSKGNDFTELNGAGDFISNE